SALRQGVDRLASQAKLVADVGEVLRVSGKQQAIGLEQGREALEDARLGLLVEIDHNVATEDGIERPLDRPLRRQQIQRQKFHHGRDLGTYPGKPFMLAAPLLKEALDPAFIELAYLLYGVDPGTSASQRL